MAIANVYLEAQNMYNMLKKYKLYSKPLKKLKKNYIIIRRMGVY